MNEINFLPDSYRWQRARQRRVWREAVLVLLAALGLAGWGWSSRQGLADLERCADAAAGEAEATHKQINEIARLQAQQAALSRQVRIQRELTLPISPTQVIAAIGQAMPDAVTVVNLTLGSRPPTPAPPDPKPDPNNPARKPAPLPGAPAPGSAVASREPEVLRIELLGVAPSDVEIADFVGRLGEHGVFNNVKMLLSRSVELRGVAAREFRLEMDVRLDRDYKPTTQPAQGVAHAR